MHKYTKNEVETAAAAVNAGCNLELGLPNVSKNIYSYLGEAVEQVEWSIEESIKFVEHL